VTWMMLIKEFWQLDVDSSTRKKIKSHHMINMKDRE
jgi:hypothetical protein